MAALNFKKLIGDNLPAILTGLGVAGAATSVVLAVKATPEAHRRIMDAQSETTEDIRTIDKVKLTWTLYIPTAASLGLTAAAIITAQSVNTRRQAAIASLYAVTEKALVDYREKVVQELGKKADQKVRDEVAKDYIMDTPMVNSEIFITNTSEALFLDSMTGRYFTSDMQSVRSAVNDVNEEIIKFNTCSQNDFYARIGLPPVRFGEEQGWNTSQMLEVNYSTQLAEDNRPCIVLEYLSHPIRGYYKESSY